MARGKNILVLLLLAALRVSSARTDNCSNRPAPASDLTCYSDYDRSITCAWKRTKESDHADAACTLHGKRVARKDYNASCHMEPVDVSSRKIRRCTMDFKITRRFQSFHNLSMSLICGSGKHILEVSFKPACNIKLDPPGRPDVNSTTVSWRPISVLNHAFENFASELQWKRRDQSWSDSSVQKKQTKNTWCKDKCEVQLDPEMLARGETHEARARVQTDEKRYYRSVWSDWGPTASWESPVGIVRPTPPAATELADFVRGVGMVVAGAALALFLAGVLFKNDKAIWVYKKMRGRPPPDPGKSFLKDLNLQHWSPYFTKESLHSPLKTEDIDSVEVISATDDDALCSKAVPLLDKERIDSTSSSFSNPSYSQLCPPPPPPPPESSTGCREEKCKIAQKNEEEERIKEMQIVQLLSKGNGNNNNGEQVQVVSGYEKVEQLHVERLRLQSLDSGVCCGEQASQESLEADGVNVGEGREGEPASRDEGKDAVFQKLFGGNGRSVVGKGSIQVCSDYEQVRELPPGSPELPSADSGVNSGGEEQASHEESLEDMETASARGAAHFLFPPPRPSPSLSLSQIVGRAALLSLSRSMETSGDGYMPVRQESG